ncbi:hypothetical protein EV385_3081 [Krasilnikovia cinnamomea]|uniref:Uncharacterized protein n=1 Tax=Krasilnikovia cinnamomea TaxID=349313 RepID=A0A4Q7ZL23_9ACTN|nr:hypothetical protein EV385_3081 [Krasilnikovia cinnamomea]
MASMSHAAAVGRLPTRSAVALPNSTRGSSVGERTRNLTDQNDEPKHRRTARGGRLSLLAELAADPSNGMTEVEPGVYLVDRHPDAPSAR